jgi:hypothetical protein
MTYLEHLTPAEQQLLQDAIPNITALIAGADGEIDQAEKDWAAKLTHIRGFANPKDLQSFYDAVDAQFVVRFGEILKSLPTETKARQATLSERLAALNPILATLEPKFGYLLYHSFVTFAEQIAKASGGILGFGSVSHEERHIMGLPMLTAIPEPPKEEGEHDAI